MKLHMHPAMHALLKLGAQRGWIGYEEINDILPDEMVDPGYIDQLLVEIDALGLELLDLRDFKVARRKHQIHHDSADVLYENAQRSVARTIPKEFLPPSEADAAAAEASQRNAEAVENAAAEHAEHAEAEAKRDEDENAEPETVIEDLESAEAAKRIDDPVRMYLTQMGAISLLTRDEEIRLAKKIETTACSSAGAASKATTPSHRPSRSSTRCDSGELPFDRTMKISTAEENAKEKIASRIPVNLATRKKMLELNREDWDALEARRRRRR